MIGSWQEEGISSIIMRSRKENTAMDRGELEIQPQEGEKALS